MEHIENWFSNMKEFDRPLIFSDGLSYNSVENFYQAMKTDDMSWRRRISMVSPRETKKLGRRVPLRKNWNSIKITVMKRALEFKFASGTSWHKKLMETSGPIIETNNWHDNFWGNCICYKCKAIPGKNMLGMLLMEIRDSYNKN